MTDTHDIAVDFMDMTDDHRLWARASDVREGFEPAVGRYAIVGDDDADPRAARIEDITDDGLLVCTKTGAHYHYEPGATGNATTIVSCCRPDMPPGQRPHSQGQSYVALQVGGKLTEVGR